MIFVACETSEGLSTIQIYPTKLLHPMMSLQTDLRVGRVMTSNAVMVMQFVRASW